MQHIAFMLPQHHLLNSGMIASGQHKNRKQERYLVGKSGTLMCKNRLGMWQSLLDNLWNLKDELPIEEVTKHAFMLLGEDGVIRSAENHFCSECTHDYTRTADQITGDAPAALICVDENHDVPVLTGENADLAVQDAAQARLDAENAMDIDQSPSPFEESPVKLVVLDGVVMGPAHCAYDN